MSKELVISSNRHETKVAILEDDQLVEVYFQRANEYSLAGSVHKGRVTRVLPGMQSAFVDLGLDRDTFLYVSDFFEENEDYDRIEGGPNPTSNTQARPERGERGERGDRGDRGERGERRDRPDRVERAPLPAPVMEDAVPAAVEAQTDVAAISPAGDAAPPRPAGEDGDRDRRGRRSRRRRRGTRGFPDSKYASAADTREEATGAAEEGESEEDDAPGAQPEMQASTRIVLPGESLAKYNAPRNQPEAVQTAAEDDDNGVPPGLTAIPDENPEEQPPVNAMPDAPVHEHVHVAGAATAPESIPHPKPLPEEVVAEEAAPETADEEVESEPAGEPENGADSVETAEAGGGDDDPEIRALILDSDGDLIEPAEGGEAPAAEGEQKTQSASVREQGGGRYLQRGRRMRGRRSRGQQSGDQSAPFREPRPEVRPEGRPEVRAEARPETHPEHRPATRPERTERAPMPSITDLLKEGQEILVQIAKEPLGQKGARITSHIALPGRFVVYMPTLDHMGVSRKIASDDERLRLKKILQKHRVGVPGGYIIRTAGEGKTEDEISSDMLFLANLWLDIRQKAEKRPAPLLLHHDLDIVQRILRDQVNDNFKSMWVDNEEMYESILRFLQRFQPTMVSRVKLYTRPAPIFDSFNVTNELEKALRPKVWLKSGGYIVINQTEALVAIDINTGKYVGKSNRLEDTIVKTNTEAVKEIVRQIRLRDLGGIIVIDFIDMDERKNRQKVMQALEDAMRSDRAPNKILQFNDFGLVAITRKRVKQSLERTLCAPCPYCEGAGYVKSVQTIIGEILQEAQKISRAVEGENNVMLRVHPDVAKLLKSNENHYLEELEEILKRPVLVTSDAALHHEKFDLA